MIANRVRQPLEVESALHGALDQHVAAILLVAPSAHQFELAHGIERAGNDRLGDAQLLRKVAHCVRRRFKIDCEQDADLANGEIRLVVPHHGKGDIVPEGQGVGGGQRNRHRQPSRNRCGCFESVTVWREMPGAASGYA